MIRAHTCGQLLPGLLALLIAVPCEGCSSSGTASPPDAHSSAEAGSADTSHADTSHADDTGVPRADASADSRPEPDATITPLGEGVATLAGGSAPGTRDGFRDEARLNNPVNLVVLEDGSVVVCDFDNSALRKISPDGLVSTLATPSGFRWPFGITRDADDLLYVETDVDVSGNYETGVLWRVDPKTGNVERLIDNFGVRRGLLVLHDGRLVAVSHRDHTVQLVDPASGKLTLLAGSTNQAGDADGTGTAARFNTPYDVVQLSDGDLVVSDKGNNRLRRVTLAGVVTGFAGDGQAKTRDGEAISASFDQPQALAIGSNDAVYVGDLGGHVIRRVAPDGAVTTVAGSGTEGYHDDSDPLLAQFFGLEGMAIDPTGSYLFVADGNRGDDGPYHRIRRIGPLIDVTR